MRHGFLDAEDCDYIQLDFLTSDWIKTGFPGRTADLSPRFNERTQKWLFLRYGVQKRMGLTRRMAGGHPVMIGSQWWCLRRQTIEKVLDFCAERPDVVRFFATT